MVEQEKLMPLFLKLSKEYAAYESSSLTYAQGQEIMASILYCLKALEDTVLPSNRQNNLQTLYTSGFKMQKEKIEIANFKYKILMEDFHDFGNTCYRETLKEAIPGFFKYYDLKYAAEKNIITFDYPTLLPLKDNSGINRMYDYIESLTYEMAFIQAFPSEIIIRTLMNHHKDYQDLLINIPQIIFNNLIATLLLESKDYLTQVSQSGLKKLEGILDDLSNEDLIKIVKISLDKTLKLSIETQVYFLNYLDIFFSEMRMTLENNIIHRLFT